MTQLQLTFAPTNCLKAVRAIMADGLWRSSYDVLRELAAQGILASESAVTARLRDLRKPQYGGLKVECRKEREWRYVYRVG